VGTSRYTSPAKLAHRVFGFGMGYSVEIFTQPPNPGLVCSICTDVVQVG
jgi:hypothetical protein